MTIKLPFDEVNRLLRYDPETGHLYWRVDRGGGVKAGEQAGGVKDGNRMCVHINNVRVSTHRVAWLLMTRSWPEHEIDHADRDQSNNRWSNLRAATRSQNEGNKPGLAGGKYKGVYPDRRRFEANLKAKGYGYLGRFATAEEAARAYDRAAIQHWGEFALTNFPREDYL